MSVPPTDDVSADDEVAILDAIRTWLERDVRPRVRELEHGDVYPTAMVEQMNRRLQRLNSLPAGRAFPYRVNLWRLGDALWLFVPGELYQTAQVTLRQRFPGRPIVVATLTGDWQPGYLPAASAYGHGIYQETIACVAAGALETLIVAIAHEIEQFV